MSQQVKINVIFRKTSIGLRINGTEPVRMPCEEEKLVNTKGQILHVFAAEIYFVHPQKRNFPSRYQALECLNYKRCH